VIRSEGQPDEQPDLKKPTALRGVVGVWTAKAVIASRAVTVHGSTLLAPSRELAARA
jgi:hypothetical protein